VTQKKIKAAVFSNPIKWMPSGDAFQHVFASGRQERLAALTDLYPHRVSSDNFDEHADRLQDLEVIFSTWQMPVLTAEQLGKLPRLRAVF